MRRTPINLQWLERRVSWRFRTGVSLHSHTLHSKEPLAFLFKASRFASPLRWVLRDISRDHNGQGGFELDLNRSWWTPPLTAREAFELERSQVRELGLLPLVSITDHDDIEAPMSLQALDGGRRIPISVEWTVPYGDTFFHLGIHNIPAAGARAAMARFRAFTVAPKDSELGAILFDLHKSPGTLIVLNHPLWDESGIGQAAHTRAMANLLANHGAYIHALELNGLRPWSENLAVSRLAWDWNRPLISGGDRHAVEPNATLNLTNAADFGEFADEIRAGAGSILLTNAYRVCHERRIFQNVLDSLKTYESHPLGWSEWQDRVFGTSLEGRTASLRELIGSRTSGPIALLSALMRLAGTSSVRRAIRIAIPGLENVTQ